MMIATARTGKNLMTVAAKSAQTPRASGVLVNRRYEPNDTNTFPKFSGRENSSAPPDLSNHRRPWTQAEVTAAIKRHNVFSWGASDATVASAVPVERADNIYIYSMDGKRYTDWGSGAVCSNLGHTVPPRVIEAVTAQMKKLCFTYGDTTYTEVRARLVDLLGKVVPGDINGFIFASGGSEANEAAIRMARKMTGRPKILSRYRSYHGATSSALAATGDFRRWFTEPMNVGFVKIMDPHPFNFKWDEDEAAGVERSLACLQDQILFEGPQSIAAIFLESISGANGWLKPSERYMQGVRSLCDQHGILLVADEVMTGFGRTGRMFGFEHYQGVVPDMITFAKGVTSSFIPLSGVGLRDHVFDFFRKNPMGYGATYVAHPVACAAGYETIQYILENNIVGHVKQMEGVMIEELAKLVENHACVKQARMYGLGGGFDLCDKSGNFICAMGETTEGTLAFKRRLLEEGIMTLVRGHHVHCTPPLIITADQIRETFAKIDKCLYTLDEIIAKS